VTAICEFGANVVPAHYSALIGPAAAAAQVRDWWSVQTISAAVISGRIVLAIVGGQVVGVGQLGRHGDDYVIYKLYLHPEHRSRGLGVELVDALLAQLPTDTERVMVEHFAANARAGDFYEREGFAVERIESSENGDPATDVVWRSKTLS
jgi:ribosomal protein S18 acetylase RimI-like enzyme